LVHAVYRRVYSHDLCRRDRRGARSRVGHPARPRQGRGGSDSRPGWRARHDDVQSDPDRLAAGQLSMTA